MAEKSEIVKDKDKILENFVNSEKGCDEEKAFENVAKVEKTFETSGNNVDLIGIRDIVDSQIMDDVWVNVASEKRNVTDNIDDENSDITLENKYEDSDHNVDIIYSTEDDNCIDTSDELTNAIDSMRIDPLNMDCEASNKNARTADMSEDTKKDGPTITETNQSVKFARIVFDATDMNKGCNTMRLKAATPMREIKKLFPKHLSATEDTFMLHFNNREVENETPLQLFGDNLEGDHNVIKIVKSIKICLRGQPFIQGKGRYLDKRPSTQFSVMRLNIATFLKEPQALIGLVYNGNEILNNQTPESVKMEHGDFLEVIKKDKMKLRFSGSIFETFEEGLYVDIDPYIVTMRKIKSLISRHVKLDQRKIMLIYKGQEPSNRDTPVSIGMYDTDIIFANLMFGIKIKGPMAAIEEFYPAEKPLIGLFQTYTEMHQMKSFVFRLNGDIVDDEDTAKSLNMVDGDCITAYEVLTIVFKGTVFRKGFEVRDIDTQRKFKDVRKYFSDYIGVDFKDLVFSIGEERVVGDDDTLESLNISNGATFISVSVKQYIQVNVLCFHLGQESLSLTSKMRLGMALEEWKSEISAQLGETLHYLSFVWENSDIADLDTPERIGIRNGDTVTVHSSNVIEIHIERDGEVLTDYLIHVDKDFFALTMWYSREFHACLNSFGFKFGERELDIISDTPSKIGLLKDGTIQVFHLKQENVITVEFYVENSSLLPIFPRLKEFPLFFDVSPDDQVILLKCLILEVFVRVIGEIDPTWIIFLHNTREINDAKTFQEIGISKGDKIGIDVREHKHDEKEVTVYVTRNMKETKSSMGKGGQLGDEETCAFKLDTSKPLSEFIKKVKSRITCNSKKEKLFLSFNDAMVNKDDFLTFNDVMVNKDDFANNLKLVPSGNNHFKCYTFPDLEAFKKHLETSRNENMSFSDSEYSFSSEDLDFPTSMPKYKCSNENSSEHRYYNCEQNQEESLRSEDFDFPATQQDKMKDVKKKVKKQKSFAITKISQLNSKLAIFESEAEAKKEQLEELECMIGELKSKLALFKCEAEAMEEQLEEDRMPANDDPKYLIQEKPEYQNAKTSNEQEIAELVKRIEERRALFNKVESIQVEGVPNHVLGSNVDNEETKDIRKQKKEKVMKPYCARASCPNKGEHKCSRCKAVFYCHQDCLNEDWPHHKMICDYVYKANKLPRHSTSKTLSEIEKACGREEVD